MLDDGGIFRQLKKALMERALGAELLTHHLGYGERDKRQPGVPVAIAATATPPKPFLTDDGAIDLFDPARPGRHLRACSGAPAA